VIIYEQHPDSDMANRGTSRPKAFGALRQPSPERHHERGFDDEQPGPRPHADQVMRHAPTG
jgi:hypothetical protein